MKNRIRELRQARQMSLSQLASLLGEGVQASTVSKLETGGMQLTQDWIEKFSRALNVPMAVVLGAAPAPAMPGLAEDVARYKADPASKTGPHLPGHGLYRVTSNVLDKIGIRAGDLVEVDETVTDWQRVAMGDVVLVELPGPPATSVMREFVEPGQLVTNASREHALPINIMRAQPRLIGRVIEVRRALRPA